MVELLLDISMIILALVSLLLFIYLPGAIMLDLVLAYSSLRDKRIHERTRRKMIKMNLGDKKWQRMKRRSVTNH